MINAIPPEEAKATPDKIHPRGEFVQSAARASRTILTIRRGGSTCRIADFQAIARKLTPLARKRSEGVVEPNTLLVGDEHAPVCADSLKEIAEQPNST